MAQGTIPSGNPFEDVHTRTTASGPQSMACVFGVDGSDSPVSTQSTRGPRIDSAGSSTLTGAMTYDTTGNPGPLTIPVRINGSTPVPCKAACITANPTNTGRIAVGDINVNATPAGFQGIPLDPGQSVTLDVNDVNSLYFQAQPLSFFRLTWQVIS